MIFSEESAALYSNQQNELEIDGRNAEQTE
jgi:hypothetical protein